MDDIPEIKLPFDGAGQSAVLAWMLKNTAFALKCRIHLKPDIFVNDILSDIFTAIVKYMEEYSGVPSKENLITLFSHKKIEEYSLYKATINDCVALSFQYSLTYLQTNISDWLKVAAVREYHLKAARYYKTGDIKTLKTYLKNTLDKINDVNFEKSDNYEFGHYMDDFTQLEQEKTNAVTTGVKEFDNLLGGGLFPGEHTVVLGGLNTGKSLFCLNVIYHNLIQKKDILWLIHEGRPKALINRLRQRFLNMTKEELLLALSEKRSDTLQELDEVERTLQEHLVFIPILKSGGLFVEDVINTVRLEQEKLFSKKGKFFDLVVDDYPKKLMSHNFTKNFEKRSSLEYVYEQFHNIAMEFGCHALSPAQVNRAGYKENRHREPGEYLGAEDISEAFGIAQDCDNFMTMNRSDIDVKNQYLYVNIDKTRGAANKQVIQFKTDYAKAITHQSGPAYGCTVLTSGVKNLNIAALATESIVSQTD